MKRSPSEGFGWDFCVNVSINQSPCLVMKGLDLLQTGWNMLGQVSKRSCDQNGD